MNIRNRIPLSVVIITKDEEKRIRDCLASVIDWADEVIVVDDESKDRTVEIAKSMGAKVLTRKMDIEGRHRNWAYSQAKNEWVLSLDADERVTEELKEEIKELLSKNPKENGFSIPRKNYIGSYWLKYGGWYPSAQLRLFRKSKFRYEEVQVHPRAFLEGKSGILKADIIHYTYRNIEDFLAKLNHQTTLEAEKWIATKRKMSLPHILWRALDRFFRRYIRKKAYKDGLYGFVVAFFDSLYQILSYLKYRELKESKNKN